MAFYPEKGQNQVLSPGAVSASVAINKDAKAVRVHNAGAANICHVRITSGASAATTADTPVPPGTVIILRKGMEEDTLSHISALGTTLHVQTGEEY